MYGKTTRNAIRSLQELKDVKEAGEQLTKVSSMIDKLAKRGVIHKNKAANLKSKLALKVNTLA
jgi:small subunit ribosomal protein S20